MDYRLGDALSLPFGNEEFDVGSHGTGTVATYVWDGPNSGHPQQPLFDALKEMGFDLS
jgi:hypothetical protein